MRVAALAGARAEGARLGPRLAASAAAGAKAAQVERDRDDRATRCLAQPSARFRSRAAPRDRPTRRTSRARDPPPARSTESRSRSRRRSRCASGSASRAPRPAPASHRRETVDGNQSPASVSHRVASDTAGTLGPPPRLVKAGREEYDAARARSRARWTTTDHDCRRVPIAAGCSTPFARSGSPALKSPATMRIRRSLVCQCLICGYTEARPFERPSDERPALA